MRALMKKLADVLFGKPYVVTQEKQPVRILSKEEFKRQKLQQDARVRWLQREAEVWANDST